MFQTHQRVTVTGPPGSARVGLSGTVLRTERDGTVVVALDAQPARPRAFRPEHLRPGD